MLWVSPKICVFLDIDSSSELIMSRWLFSLAYVLVSFLLYNKLSQNLK